MAWDPNRPVPWKRLFREASIFLALGVIAFALFLKKAQVGSYVGLVLGMFIYVGTSAALAKFGYTRQSMKDARAAQMARSKNKADQRKGGGRGPSRGASLASRPRPAPTRRTTTGPSQRPSRKRR